VISRTRTTFQTKTPVRTIFENPTIRTLAKAIEKEAPIRKQALPPGDRSRLSFAQQRLWFLDQLLPGVPLYNVDTVWRLTGALSHTHFKQAFVEVVARHETLRSRFHDDGGQPRQIIDTSTSVELSIEDLSGLAPAEAEARGRQIASESAVRPFDLAGGPLLRAQLVRLNDHEHLLVLVFHHAVIDGWSMVIFWRELTLLYDALSAGRVAELPPLRVGYAEYTAWQRLWLDSDDAAADLAYWRRTLQDAPRTTELPADHPRPAMLSGAGRLVRFDLPAQTADALRHLGVTQGATTFMVLLTAFTMLLSRYTGTSDLVTGVPSAGRALTEFEDLVGFFVNPLPVRLRWSGDPTFTELLGTTREAMLDAVAHQNMPFDRLVEELVDGRDLSRNPLFQVWFDVDSSPEVAQPKDLGVALVPLDTGNTRFDLEMRLEDRPDRLTGTLCYSTDIFADETAERLVRHFQHVLANVAAAPEERLSRLSRPDEHQQRLVLDVWSRCTTPGTTAIDDVMAKYQQRVVASGDSVALAHGDDTMTYTQLDTHANQLAHHLRNHGIGPETVVGVTLHHGFPAVISLLAVLKAGGIYLPLDTRHPT
ncbi:condensation domain-containing protein, partial [Micromonospora sp. NPDC049048]|uniref:condensation domain-containing protein n=1 Tax=Micromonospora sp. NPDC049048 TaxID=3364263 RepID=UPI003712FDA2